MIKSSRLEGAYPAPKPSEYAPRTTPRLSLGPAFIVLALVSFGLWWAIWVAFSPLIFG